MTRFEQIQQDILTLSREEKDQLIQMLLLDLEDSPPARTDEVERAWDLEVKRRRANYEAGKTQGRNIEDVFREIEERYS